MAVMSNEWLELIEKEYLRDFIVNGGAAVKFLVANESAVGVLNPALADQAARHGLIFASLNSACVKLHMMQGVFFALSRQIAWEADAQSFVEGLVERQRYQWPRRGEPVPLTEIAEANRVDPTLMRLEFNRWLTAELMDDSGMAHDFKIAMMQLCRNRLAPAGHGDDGIAPVLQWLRGELKVLSPLKNANIYTRINRYNARAMLRSLCRWVALCGHNGLLLTIDLRQVTRSVPVIAEGIRYTPGAVMDAYEVLRQLIDDADLFDRFFVTVFADHAFIGDDRKRGIEAYTALKMRIWDDVRARTRDNPLAPMVVIE
ncbi:MAG: BREX system ATP-binding domain-containing protein [Candidatus Binataceae bacterium]